MNTSANTILVSAWILAAAAAPAGQAPTAPAPQAASLRAQSAPVTSRLEIYDIATKTRTVVRQFDGRIEAPNWTPDGKFLVYNSNGLIFRIPAAGGEPQAIDTGTVKSCNNDHVLSADGKVLAISARGPAGPSQVFWLPITGGEPTLVTPASPSYLHGITPDGTQLAYCASRNGNYDIYVIPITGGEEKRLTVEPGLDDGPEYSPDGRIIWFNSVRTGLMQVWRMNVVYAKGDVEPGSHPANKNVELRLMPAAGGKPETIVRLFGGQGTLNVNSWAPDNRRFAFVSYELVR